MKRSHAMIAGKPAAMWISRYVMLFRVIAFVPIVGGLLFLLYFMPSAPSIAVLNATVQSMSFRVVVPEMSQLPLAGYALYYEAAASDLGFGGHVIKSKTTSKALCLEGRMTPEPGTVVRYERFGEEPLAIELRRDDGKPAATFEVTKGDAPEQLRKASEIRLVAPNSSDDDDDSTPLCPGTPPQILPVYGHADIGSEIRPSGLSGQRDSGTLLDGTLDIFARTIPVHLFKGGSRLYPATDTITIPGGSRITLEGPEALQRPWAGFAMPDVSNTYGLDVRLTTEAKNIVLVRPGVGLEPEVFSVGLFTQLTNDPVLISAQLVVAFLFAAFEMMSAALSWLAARHGREARPAATEESRPPVSGLSSAADDGGTGG
jgi:hypothetical protein